MCDVHSQREQLPARVYDVSYSSCGRWKNSTALFWFHNVYHTWFYLSSIGVSGWGRSRSLVYCMYSAGAGCRAVYYTAQGLLALRICIRNAHGVGAGRQLCGVMHVL
jgi:hypothetical protein